MHRYEADKFPIHGQGMDIKGRHESYTWYLRGKGDPPNRASKMIPMAETYEKKRARWLKIRQTFPDALHEVSLRNVEDISSLPKELQQVLAEAVGHIKNISRAVKMLQDNPD